jgi:hypothetical protein
MREVLAHAGKSGRPVFVTPEVVLHEVAPRGARAVAEAAMGDHKPALWILGR